MFNKIMDQDNLRFLIRRMDTLEGRIMKELKELQATRNKALGIIIGIALVSGGLGATIIEALKHL